MKDQALLPKLQEAAGLVVHYLHRLKKLCQGRAESAEWIFEKGESWAFFCLAWIFAGLTLYGWTIGWWRAPLQGFYSAVKTPFLIEVTLSATAVANWMMASLLGATFTLRQSLVLQLMGYAVLVTILLSLAPVSLFLDWAAPSSLGKQALLGQALITIFQVIAIAGAGLAAHFRLFHLLRRLCPGEWTARIVLLAWLAENLLLGSNLSWYLRPFIGNPNIPVEFYCDKAFVVGSFYGDLTEKFSRLAH
jgi:hypothetical protein